MEPYDQTIQVALEATEKEPERSDEIVLSTGVKLRFKPFPPMRIQAVAERFPYPDVPEIFNKDKERYEKNPFSEQYAELKAETDRRRGLAVVDTIMAVGTQIVSIPDTFPKVEDDDWIEELEFSAITVNKESKIARYHAWIKYVATVTEADLALIMSFAGKQTGTQESNVAEQLQKHFPDN